MGEGRSSSVMIVAVVYSSPDTRSEYMKPVSSMSRIGIRVSESRDTLEGVFELVFSCSLTAFDNDDL